MMRIHASALPRAIGRDGCPASLKAPQLDIAGTSDDADLGRAAHEAGERHVLGQEVDLAEIAAAHEVEESALAPLFHQFRKLYARYADALDVLGVEMPVSSMVIPGVTIVGTADFFATTRDADKLLVNGDLKSTESRDPLDQQIGYIVGEHDGLPAPGKCISFYLREGVSEVHDIGAAEIGDWKDRLRYAIEHPEKFAPTVGNCQFCRRALECPARTALMRASLDAMAEPGQDIKAMSPAQRGSLYLKLQAAEWYCEGVRDALREFAAEAPFILPDGREVALVDDRKERIDVEAGWPVMANEFGVGPENLIRVIGPMLSIGKGKLTEAIGSATPKGQKGRRIAALLDALRERGALIETVGKKFSIRKVIAAKKEGK